MHQVWCCGTHLTLAWGGGGGGGAGQCYPVTMEIWEGYVVVVEKLWRQVMLSVPKLFVITIQTRLLVISEGGSCGATCC